VNLTERCADPSCRERLRPGMYVYEVGPFLYCQKHVQLRVLPEPAAA